MESWVHREANSTNTSFSPAEQQGRETNQEGKISVSKSEVDDDPAKKKERKEAPLVPLLKRRQKQD